MTDSHNIVYHLELTTREAHVLAGMTSALERRIDEVDDSIDDRASKAATAAVADIAEHMLTIEEREYVKLATKAMAQRVKLRQAIIEKTLTGLIWAGFLGLAAIIADYARSHGWKP